MPAGDWSSSARPRCGESDRLDENHRRVSPSPVDPPEATIHGLSTSGSTRSGPSRERDRCQQSCWECTGEQLCCRGSGWRHLLDRARGLTAFGLYGWQTLPVKAQRRKAWDAARTDSASSRPRPRPYGLRLIRTGRPLPVKAQRREAWDTAKTGAASPPPRPRPYGLRLVWAATAWHRLPA